MIFLFIFVSLIVAVYPLNIIVDNHGSTYVEEDEVILEKILNKTLKPLGAKKVEADNLDHQEGAYKLSVTTNQDKDPSDKKILEAFVNLGFTDAKISTIDVSQESSQEGSEGDEVEYLIQLNTSSMRKTMQSLAMQESPTFKAKGSHFESDEDHDGDRDGHDDHDDDRDDHDDHDDDRDDHDDHDDDRDDHDDHDDDDDHDKYHDKNQNDDDHVKNVNVHDHDKSHDEDHDNKHHDTNNENKNHNNDHEEHDQNKNQHDKDHDRDSHEINEDGKHDKNHDDNHNNNDHDKVHKDKEQDDEDNDDADEDDDEE